MKLRLALLVLVAGVAHADVTSILTLPGGSNGSVQTNKNGRFNGDSYLTYSTSTHVLSSPGVSLSTLTANGLSYTFPSTQTGGYFLQNNGAGGLSWATPSTFTTSTGTSLGVFDGNVQISSPTAAINFNGTHFIVSLQGTTTAFVGLNPSTVTLLGSSIDLGSEVTGSLPAASIAAGSLGTGVITSSVAVGSVLDAAIVSVTGSKVSGNIPGNAVGITGSVNVSQVIGAVSVYAATATASFPYGLSASTITVTDLTASQFVKTDSAKKLVSYDLLNDSPTYNGQTSWTSALPSTFTALTVSGLTSGRCVETTTGGRLTVAGTACGSGSGGSSSSPLQITLSGVEITSPTTSINFDSKGFILGSVGSTTTVSLNPRTTDFIRNNNSVGTGQVISVAGVYSDTNTGNGIPFYPTGTGGNKNCIIDSRGIVCEDSSDASVSSPRAAVKGDVNSNLVSDGVAVLGTSFSAGNSGYGVKGTVTNIGGGGTGYAVYGAASQITGTGYGGYFKSTSAGTVTKYGVYGEASGSGPGNNYGAYLTASGGTNNYGIWVNAGPSVFMDSVTVQSPLGMNVSYNLNIGSMTGSGLSTCGDATHAVSYDATTGRFGCQLVAGTGGGGGSSSLQVTKSGVQITSPTASLNFNSQGFILGAVGSTSTIALNPATTDFIHNQATLQAGTSFYVYSGTVDNLTVNSSAYIPGSTVIRGRFDYYEDHALDMLVHPDPTGNFAAGVSWFATDDSGDASITNPCATGGSTPGGSCLWLNAQDEVKLNAPTIKLLGVTGSTQCLEVNTTGTIHGTGAACATGGGGGGSSSLAIYTGVSSFASVQVSSPTAIINYDQSQFSASLQGSATAYITLQSAISSVSADFTVGSTSTVILANTTGGNVTVTLPTAAGKNGRTITIKRISSGANTLTVATTSAQTVDGSTTLIIPIQYESINVMSDGTNWSIL